MNKAQGFLVLLNLQTKVVKKPTYAGQSATLFVMQSVDLSQISPASHCQTF